MKELESALSLFSPNQDFDSIHIYTDRGAIQEFDKSSHNEQHFDGQCSVTQTLKNSRK